MYNYLENAPSFSVLICTYNRPDLLYRALHSVILDSIENPDQVVVVNGGGDDADQVVRSFVGQVPGVDVLLVKTVNKNLAASRNIGLAHCTGEIIAMTDDDAEVFPDWVAKMKSVHAAHPEAGAVGGRVLGVNRQTLIGRIADQTTFPSWPEPCVVRTLPGVNVSYKRGALNQVGAQDETLFRGEDVDFNWRVKRLGYEIYFDPAIQVYHYHRPTLRALIQQRYMYGRAYYLVRRKWPDMYCVYPHRFTTPKDWLKLVHFFVEAFYLPFLTASRMTGWMDRLLSLPVTFLLDLIWRYGIIRQFLKSYMNGLS